MFETLAFWAVVLASTGLFAAQMATRLRLLQAAPGAFAFDDVLRRVEVFVRDVVFQGKVIARKPWVGFAHLFVFWGFVAFGGYTLVETLHGLGLVDLTHTLGFRIYTWLLVPFSVAVLAGILFLVVRRGLVRPRALGAEVSKESILIGLFIATLMVTFLLDLALTSGLASRVNWWVHMLVILAFLALVPNSKHLHLILAPGTVFLKSPVLGTVPNLDFEQEEVGLETVKDLPKKAVLDAFTCVECGRCMENCPATATGKLLNPKTLVLQNEAALLGGSLETRLVDVYDPGVLWQCTTCGACEDACPVGVEHTPVIIGARRGLVCNGEAPEYLAAVYNNLERRGNMWGQTSDVRQKFVASAQLETFDPGKHEYLLWLGCAGAFRAGLPEVAAVADCHPARARQDVRRAEQGAVHGGRRQADGQRVPVPGTRDSQRGRPARGGRDQDRHVLSALPQDDRARLQGVRLRGRGRALGDAGGAPDTIRTAGAPRG